MRPDRGAVVCFEKSTLSSLDKLEMTSVLGRTPWDPRLRTHLLKHHSFDFHGLALPG